jgi:5-formyltetrahydrofolate cyclo-ligase
MRGKSVSGYLDLEKRKIRRDFLTLRNGIEPALIKMYSSDILIRIKNLFAYKKAKAVMFYLSYGSEVITDFMINSAFDDGKMVVVPAIKKTGDEEMYAVKISKITDAYLSVYGIRQPEIEPNYTVEKDNIDLIFVPGLAFNVEGYRIGYGKGYYDRWLKNVPIEKTVGLAYDFQITDKLPIGKHDLPVGVVITEKRIVEIIKN